MSVSMVVLKEIEGFSYEGTQNSVRLAADRAGFYCVGLETVRYTDPLTGAESEYLSGNLSEVNAEMLKYNFEKGVHTRQCGFTIERPTASSYDSFTWLVHKKNYFGALDLQYLGGDFEFAFQFLVQYFKQEENKRDYLWIDDTEWVYTAEEITWLSRRPYDPEWICKKPNKFSSAP